MYDIKKGYDPARPESIEEYALKLQGKTFFNVMEERGNVDRSNIAAYANIFRKGGLGNLLEEVYFGYKANSEQEADFP